MGAASRPIRAWSPDGTKIAYAADPSGRGGSLQIFVRDLTKQGRDATVQLTSSGQNFSPAWSPDGSHIAYVSSRTRPAHFRHAR